MLLMLSCLRGSTVPELVFAFIPTDSFVDKTFLLSYCFMNTENYITQYVQLVLGKYGQPVCTAIFVCEHNVQVKVFF